jgi:hypothetical protein
VNRPSRHSEPVDPAREALKAFVRALARAAAIEDDRRRRGEDVREGGDLRPV